MQAGDRPVLTTARLFLRRLGPEDQGELTRTFSDPVVMRYVGHGLALTGDEISAMIERIARRFAADGFGMLGVESRQDRRLLGRVGLAALDPTTWQYGSRAEIGQEAEIEIGWTLSREAWGFGYATEAAMAVRDWAHHQLGIGRLISIIQVGNHRSVRVAERLGERYQHDIVTSFGKAAHLYATGQ